MAKYELEKQRRHWYSTDAVKDSEIVIAESDSYNELVKIANDTKITSGKTFYEVLNINELDDDGDIVDVSRIKTKDGK